jgi:predicted NUDIX family phosphoesterase
MAVIVIEKDLVFLVEKNAFDGRRADVNPEIEFFLLLLHSKSKYKQRRREKAPLFLPLRKSKRFSNRKTFRE